MLNFTTTTFVNDGAKVHGLKGKGLRKTDGTKGDKFYVDWGPNLYIDDEHCPKLLKKTEYVAPQLAKATITLTGLDSSKLYRIAIYIRLRNNNSSFYSNQYIHKGKPFIIDFSAKEAGATPATYVANLIKKYELFTYGEPLLNAKATSGTVLTLEATDQWQFFATQEDGAGVEIQELVITDIAGNDVTTLDQPYYGETFEDFVKSTKGSVVIDNGKEGFGDFAHIIKDLRLPTYPNTRWEGIATSSRNDDKPNPTGRYTQYTIQYDSERGIQQQSALGGLATSRTIHVFWVESAAVSAFDAALSAVGITTKNTIVQSNASNVVEEKIAASKD